MMKFSTLPFFVAVCLVVGCGSGPEPKPDAPQEDKADTAQAKPLCPDDNLDRCLVLGVMLESGYQGKPDPARAANYYAYACDKGQHEACYNLAVMEVEGRGVDKNPISARARYTAICDAGHANACANLGYLVSKGIGGDANEAAAKDLYRKACENRSAIGCANLAEREIKAGDIARGKSAFERACTLGNVSACVRHGWSLTGACEDSGCDMSDEAAMAARTKEVCVKKGTPRICATYAAHLLGGTYFDLAPKDAATLAREACDSGDGWACALHGSVVGKGMAGSSDHAGASTSYKRGCQAGFAPACTAGGVQLLEGRGVERDPVAGYALLAKGCKAGDSSACNTLLLLCQQGDDQACDAQ